MVSSGRLVTNDRVNRTGEVGILMGGAHSPSFAHNRIASPGLGGGSLIERGWRPVRTGAALDADPTRLFWRWSDRTMPRTCRIA